MLQGQPAIQRRPIEIKASQDASRATAVFLNRSRGAVGSTDPFPTKNEHRPLVLEGRANLGELGAKETRLLPRLGTVGRQQRFQGLGQELGRRHGCQRRSERSLNESFGGSKLCSKEASWGGNSNFLHAPRFEGFQNELWRAGLAQGKEGPRAHPGKLRRSLSWLGGGEM